MGEREGPRRAHGRVEARLADRPGHAFGILVEDDREVVAWRIVELLHHQPATPGGARPVHRPKRLAGRVVADSVDLEAGRAPEPRSGCSGITRTVRREDGREGRDAGPDQNVGRLVDLLLDARKPERVGEHDIEGSSRWRPRGRSENDDDGARAVHPHRLLERAEALAQEDRAAEQAPAVPRPDLDREIVSLDSLAGQQLSLEVDRALGRACPEAGEHAGGDEPEADDDERGRAERPRCDEGSEPESDRAGAPPSHTGTGVPSSASRTTSSGPSPAERASERAGAGARARASAISRMSSGVTKVAPLDERARLREPQQRDPGARARAEGQVPVRPRVPQRAPRRSG